MTDISEPAGIQVRPARQDDMPALGALGALLVTTHHAFDPARFMAATGQTADGYARFLAGEIGRETVLVLVAEREGRVIGYAYGELEGTDYMTLRGPAGVIHDLVVDPVHRKGGVGRRLLDAIVARLSSLGAPRIVLSTAERNRDAQRLFAGADFRPTMIEMTREPV